MKKFLSLILILSINIILGLNSINAFNNETGKHDFSPYYFVGKNKENFGTVASFVNPNNISKNILFSNWCSEISDSERAEFWVPYGTTWMYCDWSPADFMGLLNSFKEAKVANMVGFKWSILTDVNLSRFYLLKFPVKITDTSKLSLDSEWNVWYKDNNLDTDNMFLIYDPDLSNKFDNNTGIFETNNLFWQNTDEQAPNMFVSLYSLDGARMTDSILQKWLYNMEHFLWKKYTSNGWSSLQTQTFDGFNLYDMTFYNESSMNLLDYYRYCNGDLYWNSMVGEFYHQLNVKNEEFQDENSDKRIIDRRSGAWYCWGWTSWLRINKSIDTSIMNNNWSLKFFYRYGSDTTDRTTPIWFDNDFKANFEPDDGNGNIWVVKLPHVWTIGNINLLQGIDSSNYKPYYQDKVAYIYIAAKVSLGYEDYNSNDWNSLVKDPSNKNITYSNTVKSNNKYLDWFDPIDNDWYDNSNHIQYVDVMNDNYSFSSSDKNTEAYKQMFSYWYTWTWQGNMFIPFSMNASLFNISTSWFVMQEWLEDQIWDWRTEDMKRRWANIPLTAAQWYIVTETANWVAWHSGISLGITSGASINLEKVLTNSRDEKEFLFNRNLDADSNSNESSSNWLFDKNLWLKVFISSPTNSELAFEKVNVNNNNMQVDEITWSTCSTRYNLPTSDVWWIMNKGESYTECWDTSAFTRLSWNLADNNWFLGSSAVQTLTWILPNFVNNSNIENKIVTTNIYENVNDLSRNDTSANYNQINTTSNFLENIPANNISCSLNISKLIWDWTLSDNYESDYLANKDLNSDPNYSWLEDWLVGDIYASDNLVSLQDGDLLKKILLDPTAKLTSSEKSKIAKYYPSGDFTAEKWLLWEIWYAGYSCTWLPSDGKYTITVTNSNDKFVKTTNEKDSDYVWNWFKKDSGQLPNALIEFNPNQWLGVDNSGNLNYSRTVPFSNIANNVELSWFKSSYIYGDFVRPNSGEKTLWFSTTILSGWVSKAEWIATFKVTNQTDSSSYWKIYFEIMDENTWDIVAFKEIYMNVSAKTEPIELFDAVKNEQILPASYNSSMLSFNGDGTQFWMSFSIRNTTNSDMHMPTGASAGWRNVILLGSKQAADSSATLFPLWSDITSKCSSTMWSTTEYDCWIWTTANQDTAELFNILDSWWSITITENTNGVTNTYTAVNSATTLSNNYTYVIAGSGEYIALSFPNTENYIKWNTIYTIELSAPAGAFSSSTLWQSLTNTSNEALMVVPSMAYLHSSGNSVWDLSTTTFVANWLTENLFYRPQMDNSNPVCLSELTSAPSSLYQSGWWIRVFLTEKAAQANWTTCTDSNVKCLFEFTPIASNSNFHNYESASWRWLNILWNDDMRAGRKYSLLVETVARWLNPSNPNNNAAERDLYINNMEMWMVIDYDANFTPSKAISAQTKTLYNDINVALTENPHTSKVISSRDMYGDNFYYYDETAWTWEEKTTEKTHPYDGYWYYSNLMGIMETWTLYARSSGANGTSDSDRTTYNWLYWTITGGKTPTAEVIMAFWTHNVPDILQWETCRVDVEFPTIQPCEVSEPDIDNFEIIPAEVDDFEATDIDDFMSEDSSLWNDIDTCWQGLADTDAFSIERRNFAYDNNGDPTAWMMIVFDVDNNSRCGSGDYSIASWTEVQVRINLEWRRDNFSKCMINASDLWVTSSDVDFWSDYVEISNLEIDAWDSKEVRLYCSFNENEPDCSSPANDVEIEVRNAMWLNTSNTARYKKCMLPTLLLEEDAEVDDWNGWNDRDEWVYSTAYPFEFSQCNEEIEHSFDIDYQGWCGITDNAYKDFKLIWNKGTSIDDLWTWRDFIWNISASSIRWVSPDIYADRIEWDFNNGNISDITDSTLRARIDIEPTLWERLRFENSYFELENNRPDLISADADEDNTDNNCNSSMSRCTSRNLSSAIWLNPEISNDRLYDIWLYWNENNYDVILHKNEIDESSKIWTVWGVWHRENVTYEVSVSNPAQNAIYWLWNLDFNLDLNSDSYLFDTVDETADNKTGGWILAVSWQSPLWSNISLVPWNNVDLEWNFKLHTDLNSVEDPDYMIEWNSQSSATWLPSLKFSSWLACDYNEWFNEWSVSVIDNPIVINSFELEDDSPTPDWWNQHLPWDIMNFKVTLENTNSTTAYKDTVIEIDFNDNSSIPDTNLWMDLNKIFDLSWGTASITDPYYWIELFDLNGWTEQCWIDGTKLICIIKQDLQPQEVYVANIRLLINIDSDYYELLKASTAEEKYWYPVTIERISYWTPDLNSVAHAELGNIIYYTSDIDNIPSGDRRWDIESNDFNDPAVNIIEPAPNDWLYNFYIGVPYIEIETNVINTAVWNFSPWDIINFQTIIRAKSKSYIRNPKITQKMFKNELMDFLDTELMSMEYQTEKTNFNTPAKFADLVALNKDTDPTNDVVTSNIVQIDLENDVNWLKNYNLVVDTMKFYSDWPVASYLEWTETPDIDSWWTITINSKVKIVKLKKAKKPQIGCWISETLWCDRWFDEWTNPKQDFAVWQVDLEAVWTVVDAFDEVEYFVYFPILKSVLFQQQNDSYLFTPWSNNIKGIINDPDTEVIYRVDNFIPSEYNAATDWIWKARNPMAFIRLPVGVRYTPNSARTIENLQDIAPYWSEVEISDPIVSSKTEYEWTIETWTNTYLGDMDNIDPDGDLLPTPEEIIEEENNWTCLYGEWLYGICILWL